MLEIINITEIVVSLFLIIAILLQNRGSGLSGAFGGGGGGGYYTRRGFEKFLVTFSIILSALLIILALTSLIIAK